MCATVAHCSEEKSSRRDGEMCFGFGHWVAAAKKIKLRYTHLLADTNTGFLRVIFSGFCLFYLANLAFG